VPADGNRGRAAARRRIEEKRAVEAAARARAERRRRTVIGGIAAAVAVVIALVVVIAVQSHRTTTSAGAAVPAHTIDNGMVIPVAATTGGTGAAAPSSATKPVVVDLYEDLQCPICKAFESRAGGTLAQLVASGTVVVHYHPMAFLDSSANQQYATRALNAAAVVLNAAGDGAFQKFHDLLYAHQSPETGPGLTDAQLTAYAQQVGVRGPAVEKAIDDLTYGDWVKKVTDQASKDGVTGTPTVLVGGKTLQDLTASGVTAAVQSAQNS
jgi:protein-disulfide isomerase